jgi:phosphate acyltransferase
LRTIALDAMGGDVGPDVVVPAAVRALERDPTLTLVLVGDEAQLTRRLSAQSFGERLSVKHASQSVGMDEPPAQALRNKKDSSMRIAIELVKSGDANACVSAGNTGALMATGRFVLKTIAGIDRPAICSSLPTLDGHTHVLDLGANVDCTSEHLLQFALMGAVLASAVDDNPRPRVGLLNIGEETIKGNEQVKSAAVRLSQSDLNYIGYVEGDGVFEGVADVVVCDGFAGNVALKSTEGSVRLIAHFMRAEFERNWLTRLAALVAMPVLRSLRQRIDPRHYNGASLLGLRGIVVKSHGGADELSFANAIAVAAAETEQNVPNLIESRLQAVMQQAEAK